MCFVLFSFETKMLYEFKRIGTAGILKDQRSITHFIPIYKEKADMHANFSYSLRVKSSLGL